MPTLTEDQRASFQDGYLAGAFADAADCCEGGLLPSGLSDSDRLLLRQAALAMEAVLGDDLIEALMCVGYDGHRAGMDGWLTQHHHGAGFWDRIEIERGGLGVRLTAAAHRLPEVSVFGGEDGLAHVDSLFDWRSYVQAAGRDDLLRRGGPAIDDAARRTGPRGP